MRCYLFTSIYALAAFVVFIGHGTSVAGEELSNKINVDVYYESLCPDSKYWLRVQLAESYHIIGDYINLNLIPYGKASHSRNSESGSWQFSCQHGPDECDGNKAQACAINAIKNNEPANAVQRFTEMVVVCAMSTSFPPSSVQTCAEKLMVSQKTQDSIKSCIGSPLADDLLAEHGKTTAALNPPLSFVPTIVLNGVYSQQNQNRAYNNFLKLICINLPEGAKPSGCSTA